MGEERGLGNGRGGAVVQARESLWPVASIQRVELLPFMCRHSYAIGHRLASQELISKLL